ncbi:MAG TPA: phospho-N-acetylmuramoyl-pentapeptide-transferase [Candidatus Atribacteria bacterium]|nr:phospho-N-acetylmuramoyl-pentapeptide-transferase [Candidatus Atribacteria bacterium]
MTNWILIALVSFLIPLVISPLFIKYLKKYNIGQRIRQEGPDLHQHKMGTPTMGGIVIILTLILVIIFFVPHNNYIFCSLIITISFGFIGLIDDLIKFFKKRSLGLYTWQKLFFQIVFALIVIYYIQKATSLGTEIYLPFLNGSFDLGKFFTPFAILVLISSVNAVNLTDGLDGLATGLIFIAMISFALIAYIENIWFMSLFALIIAFSSLGFLIYNFFPAQVFLGDVGSFALGGALASVAIFTKTELFLLLIGGVFVIETLSVIFQVISVKLRKKLLFKMSPIHHHFEICGWKEPKIIIRFWIAGVILAFIWIASL